jgi:prepilin-type N-terminal cleavage/methylation domain-containing protein
MNKINCKKNINPRAGILARGFTFVELMIVLIILGILIAFALPSYFGTQTSIRQKEAQSILGMIQNSEKTVQLETRAFVACGSNAACAASLKTYISAGYWTYSVTNGGADFCASATHAGVPAWYISNTSAAPCNTGCVCP